MMLENDKKREKTQSNSTYIGSEVDIIVINNENIEYLIFAVINWNLKLKKDQELFKNIASREPDEHITKMLIEEPLHIVSNREKNAIAYENLISLEKEISKGEDLLQELMHQKRNLRNKSK